jgi:hypothetical protein
MPSLWQQVADLEVRIDDWSVQRRELVVSPQFTRVTTTVVLHADDDTGQGEDVTYTASDHDDFPTNEMLAGTWTLHALSRRLDELELWQEAPQMEASHDYRRWAFESAALDLALQQAGISFAKAVGRSYAPVRFVASTRADIEPYRELNPALESSISRRTTAARPSTSSPTPSCTGASRTRCPRPCSRTRGSTAPAARRSPAPRIG